MTIMIVWRCRDVIICVAGIIQVSWVVACVHQSHGAVSEDDMHGIDNEIQTNS